MYAIQRQRQKCGALWERIAELMNGMESLSLFVDNVNLVEKNTQELERLCAELCSAYQEWQSYLDNDTDITLAHAWYEENRLKAEKFIAGMKDWIVVAKSDIEERLEEPVSEAARSTTSSQRSSASARALQRIKIAELTAASNLLGKKQALRNEMEKLDIEEKLIIAKARELALIDTDIQEFQQRLSRTVPTFLPSQQHESSGYNDGPGYLSLNVQQFKDEEQSTPRPPLKQSPATPPFPFVATDRQHSEVKDDALRQIHSDGMRRNLFAPSFFATDRQHREVKDDALRQIRSDGMRRDPFAPPLVTTDRHHSEVMDDAHRQVNTQGQIHCAFLLGKARIAPIKPVTVPRLELTAAVVSSKLGNQIAEELDRDTENSMFFWTDSTTVIKYIVNEQNRYQTYVANRVEAIRSQSNPDQWKFLPGKDNPADDASRGLESLDSEHRWICGPDFLWKPMKSHRST